MNKTKGIIAAVAAYLIWGVLPAYWKLLQAVPSDRILAHRIVWSFAFLLLVIPLMHKTANLKKILAQRKVVLLLSAAALVVTINWFTYIYAVNSGQIVAGSLGYYINPLVSIAMGAIFFKERFRKAQIAAIGLAIAGVAVITIYYGRLPWLSLVLAFSFGTYGLLKKKINIDSTAGLIVETGLLLPPALGYLIFAPATGLLGDKPAAVPDVLAAGAPLLLFLLPFAGVATAIPLLLFTYATQNLDLSLVGFLQYLAPSLMLVLGVLVYNEQFTYAHAICFGLIWAGLILYTVTKLRGNMIAKKELKYAHSDD